MADRIATIKGIWVRPGVSKNRRWYKPEHIKAAVTEAQQRLESGSTFANLTCHGDRDPRSGDVTRTAGRITKVGLDSDSNGTFEAELADTQAGRDVAALVTPSHPFLKGVSMASRWKGTPTMVRGPDGLEVESSDVGFTLEGIDFTHAPGVDGAEIKSAELLEADAAPLIFESIEEVAFTEAADEAAAANTEGTDYADPGYQSDKKKRYPLTSAKRVRAAWGFINQKANADKYTSTQVKRIKGKIKKAAKKFGIDIAQETELLAAEITEAYASVCLDNGPGTVRVSAFTNEPEQLKQLGRRAAIAALAAISALDPDQDGDIDLADDTGDDTPECPSCHADLPPGAVFCPLCGQPIPQTESAPADPDKKEAPVGTETNPGAATESVTLTKAELDAKINEAAKAAAREALEAAGIKPQAEESAEVKDARAKIAEANKVLEAAGLPLVGDAPASSAPAPGATAPGTPATEAPESDELAKMHAAFEAKLKEQAEAFEAKLGDARSEIARTGLRRGFPSKDALEAMEAAHNGPKPLWESGRPAFEKAADAAFTPFIGA